MSEEINSKSNLDEYGVWVKSSKTNLEKPGIKPGGSLSPDTETTAGEAVKKPETPPPPDDFVFPDDISDIGSFVTPESNKASKGDAGIDSAGNIKQASEASAAPTGEEDIDLDSFMGGGSNNTESAALTAPADEPGSGDSSRESGEIDLSSFMEDTEPGVKEAQPEIEDREPLDIDLEFDDTADNTHGETEEDMYSFLGSGDDFDSLFENIETENSDTTADIAETQATPDNTVSSVPAGEPASAAPSLDDSEEIDLSDFGFDDSEENLTPVIEDNTARKEINTIDYNLAIDGDVNDNDTGKKPEPSPVVHNRDEEEIKVDIALDSKPAEQKEQETDYSSPDDSFDLDSLLSSVVDEAGNTVGFPDEEEKQASEVPQAKEAGSTKTDTPITLDDSKNMTEKTSAETSEPGGTPEEEATPDEAAPDVTPDIITDENKAYSASAPSENGSQGKIDAAGDITAKESAPEEGAAPGIAHIQESDAGSASAGNATLFTRITEELDSLKREINGLKTELEEIKKIGNVIPEKDGTAIKDETPQNAPEIPIAEGEAKESPAPEKSATLEDDSITLNSDELGNILDTAEFTAEEGKDAFEEDKASQEKEPEGEIAKAPASSGSVDKEDSTDETATLSEDELGDILNTVELTSEEYATVEPPLEDNSGAEEEITIPVTEKPKVAVAEKAGAGDISPEDKIENASISTENPAPFTGENETRQAEGNVSDINFSSPEGEEEKSAEQEGMDSASNEETKPASGEISGELRDEVKAVLSYMDQLLENLPDDKIEEFAKSNQFVMYKKLFNELGLS